MYICSRLIVNFCCLPRPMPKALPKYDRMLLGLDENERGSFSLGHHRGGWTLFLVDSNNVPYVVISISERDLKRQQGELSMNGVLRWAREQREFYEKQKNY